MGDEYDAFGRSKDENPLAGLGGEQSGGWSTDYDRSSLGSVDVSLPQAAPPPPSPPPPAVTTAPPPSPPSAPPPLGYVEAATGYRSPPVVRRARRAAGIGTLVRLMIFLAILGGVAAAVIGPAMNAVDEVGGIIEDVKTAIPETGTIPGAQTAPAQGRPPVEPRGLNSTSLVRRSNFAAALRRLRRGTEGRLQSLRVAPERINATLWSEGGRISSAQVEPGGAPQVFGGAGSGFPAVGLISYSDVDLGAPERLVRQSARQTGRPVGGINYLVMSRFGETIQWNAYFKDGTYTQGDSRGRFQRKISG